MKKYTKLFALILALCLVFSLAACSKSGASVVGVWKYTLDFSKAMESAGSTADLSALGSMGDSLVDAFKDMNIILVLDLREDNTCKFYVDEASARAAVDQMMSKMGDILPGLLASMLGVSEAEIMEMLEAEGVSMDDVMAEMMGQFSTEDLVSQLAENSKEGTYRFENGKLYLTETGKAENTDKFLAVELNGNEMRVTDVVGVEGFESYKTLLPMVFVR
ncbi:MAG: hypothetical protein J5789_04670 [Oscillospiraceae bacterium]|nr:hypothetical protein [Oscillospiraceae bacterium]